MDTGTETVESLRAQRDELCHELRNAIQCVQYCRRAHADAQGSEGVPVEALWLQLLARIEGREFSTEDFLKACMDAYRVSRPDSPAHGDSK